MGSAGRTWGRRLAIVAVGLLTLVLLAWLVMYGILLAGELFGDAS